MEIFNTEELIKLNSILSLILPTSDSGMPESLVVLDNLENSNNIHLKFIEACKILCNKVEQIENQEHLDLLKKRNFRDFSNFVNMFLIIYYSKKEVLKKMSVGSIPPFPDGNYVKEGDIYLLEQVYLKEKIYID
jgi:hypothetical protein